MPRRGGPPIGAARHARIPRIIAALVVAICPLPGASLSLGLAAKAALGGADLERQQLKEDDADLTEWIPLIKATSGHIGSLEELAGARRVVVVMTTVPARIDRLEPVLDSIIAQTWPVQAIHLSIPYRYNRTGEDYKVPDFVWQKPRVVVNRCTDLGPGTHLLNGLRIEQDPWTYIVIVDDDHIYAYNMVETLMRSAIASPGAAIAAQGFLSVPGLKVVRDKPRYLHDQGFAAGPVLVSYLGVVYQRGFFDDAVFDYSRAAEQCLYQDDMWFSAHLAIKGIPRMVIGGALGVQELRDLHLGPSSLTLWKENPPQAVSMKCNLSLLRMFPDIWVHRRRVVLAVDGLPALAGPTLVDGPDWPAALATLGALPHAPDLVYLCSKVADGAVGTPTIVGQSLLVDGVRVTGALGCDPYAAESGIGLLLRDPMHWEGDPQTVLVVGNLREVAALGAGMAELVACAGVKQQQRWKGANAFCRSGEVVAISVGSFDLPDA